MTSMVFNSARRAANGCGDSRSRVVPATEEGRKDASALAFQSSRKDRRTRSYGRVRVAEPVKPQRWPFP